MLLMMLHLLLTLYVISAAAAAAAAAAAGKGVSSSAALEVAVMTALAAAHDCSLSGRELAILCQKAEVWPELCIHSCTACCFVLHALPLSMLFGC
jgi:hypothetical protein